jgi:hypothetical protein
LKEDVMALYKRMIVTIGHQRFACDTADALKLLELGARLVRVERAEPSQPFHPVNPCDPLIHTATIADYDDTPWLITGMIPKGPTRNDVI